MFATKRQSLKKYGRCHWRHMLIQEEEEKLLFSVNSTTSSSNSPEEPKWLVHVGSLASELSELSAWHLITSAASSFNFLKQWKQSFSPGFSDTCLIMFMVLTSSRLRVLRFVFTFFFPPCLFLGSEQHLKFCSHSYFSIRTCSWCRHSVPSFSWTSIPDLNARVSLVFVSRSFKFIRSCFLIEEGR